MKKALLYLLLFSYITIVCKPVIPSLSDIISHICWYTEHMATVHYEHGKYHVHYEYQQAAKNESPEKDTGLPKLPDIVGEHLAGSCNYPTFPKPALRIYFVPPPQSTIHTIQESIVPPPKA